MVGFGFRIKCNCNGYVSCSVLENRKRKRESDASSASPAPPAKRYKAEDVRQLSNVCIFIRRFLALSGQCHVLVFVGRAE